jgi:hypothetical protein
VQKTGTCFHYKKNSLCSLVIFVKKCHPTPYLNGYPNISIFNSGLLAIKKKENTNDSLECKQDIRKVVGD